MIIRYLDPWGTILHKPGVENLDPRAYGQASPQGPRYFYGGYFRKS